MTACAPPKRRATRRHGPNEPRGLAVACLCVLVVCLCLGAACGRKTAPKPPELVLPETVDTLAAANKLKGILLTWKRPERYTGGDRMRDLAGFRIERATGDDVFAPLATLPVTDRDRFRQIKNFSYLDAATSEGERYRYRLFSFTQDGHVSAVSNEATCGRQTPTPPPPP